MTDATDACVTVTLNFTFAAEDVSGDHPVDFPSELSLNIPFDDDGRLILEGLVEAIEDYRVFAFMMDHCADLALTSGDWLARAAREGGETAG